jgi:NitT/TauT family transport system permease protein
VTTDATLKQALLIRKGESRRGSIFVKLLVVVVLLAAWETLPIVLQVNRLVFPPLHDVLIVIWERILDGTLTQATGATLWLLLRGVLIGAVLAFVMTALCILLPRGEDVLQTLVALFNPLPAIAILPVSLLWFGFTETAIILVVVFSVVWPMTLSVYSGFSSIRPVLVDVGRNLGLRGPALISGIYIPATLPSILSGLRIGWAFGWRTGVAAELVYGAAGGQGGIGWQIYVDRSVLDTAGVFSGLLAIIIVGVVVEYGVFQVIENRTVRKWKVVR